MEINSVWHENLDSMKSKRINAAIAVMTGIYCSLMVALPAFAAGTSDEIVSGITSGTQAIWNIIVGVAGPIAAIALALQVIKIVWGGSKAAEEAKGTAIKIIIATAVVLMAPAIISIIQGWFTKADWSFKY